MDDLRAAFADAFMVHPTGRMTDAEVMAVLDDALAATGDSRPVHVHDYGAARIPCSQDHGDSRQSEGRDIIALAIHRVCPSRVKHGFAYHWPEADAALAAIPEPTLDAAVRKSAEDLTISFRRFCIRRFGIAPTVEELRGILDAAARLHERTASQEGATE